NIFKGTNGQYNPNHNITRSQMATVLVGAFHLAENDSSVELVDSKEINESHRQNVKILAQNDITRCTLNQNNERYFDGRHHLTRSQFAVFLQKAMHIN